VRVEGGEFKILADGTVVSGQNPVDRLRVVAFQDRDALVKEGAGYFSAPGLQPGPAAATKVQQGALEGSNVELTGEMVRLVEGVRAYQLCQRALRTHDALLDRAVNQVGKTD
jgi:flagellar basal-body rod protein FlgG